MSDGYTIFHNPNCTTSRNVLAMIREAGHEPEVVQYLKTGWTEPQLQQLLKAMGRTPRDLLRTKERLAAELGLRDAQPETILDAMVAHPVLVERPIVVTPKGTVLARPKDAITPFL
ncbi:arsenate reductase (glutaredoxin) [Roseococcus pinisoli]|uniref:Arsenate reductase n=1 Tax=Roseococcus pinisoli TaxID=2835040 RepID=A0ABS5Q9U7_9PROT|nr:arsenate reductase (glutaredoxin) [Roseococcus pinisoli]MBS7810257.1 arsenate reductase (glutaredoxin) [Roseococcus pinisoli]